MRKIKNNLFILFFLLPFLTSIQTAAVPKNNEPLSTLLNKLENTYGNLHEKDLQNLQKLNVKDQAKLKTAFAVYMRGQEPKLKQTLQNLRLPKIEKNTFNCLYLHKDDYERKTKPLQQLRTLEPKVIVHQKYLQLLGDFASILHSPQNKNKENKIITYLKGEQHKVDPLLKTIQSIKNQAEQAIQTMHQTLKKALTAINNGSQNTDQ